MTTTDRRVTRLLTAHALSATAMSLPWPWLLVVVWDASHSPALLGVAASARMLPYVAFSWWAGRIGDRCRRDVVVRASMAVRLVLLCAVPVSVWLDRPWWAVAAAAASIAAATPAYPALAAAMPDAAGTRAEPATEALVTIEVASFVVGPAIGGLLLFSPATLTAASLGATAFALGLMRGVRLATPPPRVSSGRGTLSTVRDSRPIRRAMTLMALLNLVVAAVGVTLLLLAREDWTGRWSADTGYGVASGALGFGALLAPALVRCGTGRVSRSRIGVLLVAVGVAGAAASPDVPWAVTPLLLVGAAAVHAESAATSVVQSESADEVRASLFGVADTCMVGAALMGALVAPLLAEAVGPRLFLALAALAAASVALLARGLATGAQALPSTAVAPTSSSVSIDAPSPDATSSAAVRSA